MCTGCGQRCGQTAGGDTRRPVSGGGEGVPDTPDLESVWARAIDSLADSAVSPQHRAFLRLTRPLGLVEDTALLAASNEFAKDVLETRLRPQITAALSAALGRQIRIAVTVRPDDDHGLAAPLDDRDRVHQPEPPFTERTGPPMPAAAPAARPSGESSRLNPKYKFETFVIGSSNRFAHAAAVAVAEAPAKAYNPLFIYGESGLARPTCCTRSGITPRTCSPTCGSG